MAQEGTEKALGTLDSLLAPYRAFITYQPFRTEVAFDFIGLPETALVDTIPPRASLDPAQEAARLISIMGAQAVVILIPGRRFDASGTRYGQGGGWYDRFLAAVPREWLRIGICYDDQLSPTLLVRESWDQAMDYVVVVNRKTADVSIYSSEGTL